MFPFFFIDSPDKYVDYVTKMIKKTSVIKIFTYLFRIDPTYVLSYGWIETIFLIRTDSVNYIENYICRKIYFSIDER
jgi:hypothetical protein